MVCMVVSGICIFYIIFAEFTNMGFSWDPDSPYVYITEALPAISVFTYVLKSIFTVNLFFSYPL